MIRIINKLGFGLVLLLLFSCEQILLVDNISEKEVTLVTPTNEAQFFSTGVSFSWEPVKEATKYRLQIAKPNFMSPQIIVLDTLMVNKTFTRQLNIGNYEWRVKAVNSNYETAFKNRFFTVVSNQDFQNNTVALSSPANNLKTNVATQNLTWQPVIGASSYQLQIYDNANTIVSDQNITTTNSNYTFLQGNYQWRVRASNGSNQTLYTSRSILVDTTNPNTPNLTAPVNNSSTTNTTVSFQWSRTPIAGSVETDKIYIYSNSGLTNLVSTTQITSPFSTILSAGIYYWYVKSFDEAGNMSNQSTVFSVTVN
jgi:hypothetical protein